MSPRERGRMQVPGHRVDDGSHHTLVMVQEADRDWTIHGLGAALRLEEVVLAQVCRAVLAKHAQGPGAVWSWYLRDPRDLTDAHLATCCLACSVAHARCGATFKPALVFDFGQLPVQPPHERACAQCQEQQGRLNWSPPKKKVSSPADSCNGDKSEHHDLRQHDAPDPSPETWGFVGISPSVLTRQSALTGSRSAESPFCRGGLDDQHGGDRIVRILPGRAGGRRSGSAGGARRPGSAQPVHPVQALRRPTAVGRRR